MKETKLNGESINIVNENIQQLKQLFPEVFAEESIDFDKLKAVLGEYVDNDEERYNFTWWGKNRALRLAQTPSTGTLRPCPEESKNWDTTENLYIEGDNLEVLKLLQKTYHNKIKMIYIDPPYNTGNDFVYPDDYRDGVKHYKEITGQVDSEGQNISTNSESDGRYHTNWLNMIFPRLRLARTLLADEGVLFVSVDDNEVENLKKVCDEIFGERNYLGTFVWKRRQMVDSRTKTGVSQDHEYALCYGKTHTSRIRGKAPDMSKYTNPDNDPRGNWMSADMTGLATASQRPNLHYDLLDPETNRVFECPPTGWRYEKTRMEKLIQNNEIIFPKKADGRPRRKKFQSSLSGDYAGFSTVLDTVYNTQATRELRAIFDGKEYFDFPKPVDLIKIFIEQGTNKDENDIILDFFSGSATTAHATVSLNAEDGGKRRFILVQLPEPTDKKSEAYKAGFSNISEIGIERIKRAGEILKSKLFKKHKVQQGQMLVPDDEKVTNPDDFDVGFKVFKLDSSNIKKWSVDADNLDASLFDSIENFVEGRSELDVVHEIMLKYGIDLTLPIETFSVGNIKIYSVGLGALIICLDNEITTKIANEIVRLKSELSPEVMRVVFKDNGFKDDSAKTNTKEILRTNGVDEIVSI